MITVRFPSGFSLVYSNATYVSRSERYSDLLTKKDGSWVAQVPNEAVIELESASRAYSPVSDEAFRYVAEMSRTLRSIKREMASLRKARGK